jgi:VWFA-related protein
MKTEFAFYRFLLCIGFCLIVGTISNAQENEVSPQENSKNFVIQVGVEEVRLDVVVLKGDRHQAVDLTSDDFDVYQDGKQQKITSCIYINENQHKGEINKVFPRNTKTAPLVAGPMLQREEVNRIFVFIVDNLSFGFEDYHFARTGLKHFIENEMQQGDMVAILQTAGGNAAIQMFTSDKRILQNKISNLLPILDPRTVKNPVPQFAAISYFLKALQDMPGQRKYMIIIAHGLTVPYYMKLSLNGLADAALRAGVVIHMLKANGLEVTNSGADILSGSMVTNPLPEKTGGLSIQSNWMFTKSGLSTVGEHIKGYYLLSYIPPPGTFNSGTFGVYHQIKVKVKRPWHAGYEVHTRDGFIGISKPSFTSADNTLQKAIFSPFKYNDLNVYLSSGYFHDPQGGYQLKSWIHLEGKDLNIVERKDGSHYIKLEAACLTSDIGAIRDSSAGRYEFNIKNEHVPLIKERGINFSLLLPVKNPGSYYIRAAVKELESGKIGSAYQFIEIPDLKNRSLFLSNIFLVNSDEDLPWMKPKTTGTPNPNLLIPGVQQDSRKSPAVRNYFTGENVKCVAVIYNAKADKNRKPNLESRLILYLDGQEIYKTEPEAVDINNVNDFSRILIRRKLLLDNSLQPGNYALLLQVNEIHEKKKDRIAKQAIDFKILARSLSFLSRPIPALVTAVNQLVDQADTKLDEIVAHPDQ